MKNNWLIALYKVNEIQILKRNLLNQKIDYYLPTVTKKMLNSTLKEEMLFPGYIFVKAEKTKYSSLKYTMGIKNILRFGNYIPSISDEDIKAIKITEKKSKVDPVPLEIKIGQEAFVANGPFKGNIVRIYSLPSKKRVSVLLTFLGSLRNTFIPLTDIAL